MSNPISSTGFYMQENSIESLPILPGTLMGYPNNVVLRMSQEGIITRAGSVYLNRASRRVWKEGPNWGRMCKWWAEHV